MRCILLVFLFVFCFVKLLSLREEYVRGRKPVTERANFLRYITKTFQCKAKIENKGRQQHVSVLSRGTFIVHLYQERKEEKK